MGQCRVCGVPTTGRRTRCRPCEAADRRARRRVSKPWRRPRLDTDLSEADIDQRFAQALAWIRWQGRVSRGG